MLEGLPGHEKDESEEEEEVENTYLCKVKATLPKTGQQRRRTKRHQHLVSFLNFIEIEYCYIVF